MEVQSLGAALSIILIDLVLNGDNAVVMGAAHYVHRHRPKMRRLRQQQAPID